MSEAADMGGYDDEYQPEEDEVVERYRNWAIRRDVGGRLYIGRVGDEEYVYTIEEAHKEIDKKIKKWNGRRSGNNRKH